MLCPESVPQAPMLRPTKCKDSENNGHNAAMRTSRRKCACTLGAENVHKSNTILCGGKL